RTSPSLPLSLHDALPISGLRGSFRPPSGDAALPYSEYFFPGTVVLILLFTAIFSTISLIEDRREGFLQGVLVAPIPRSSTPWRKDRKSTRLNSSHGSISH